MKSEERIETLIQLGLTNNQARAYLTLLKTDPATAKEISENSKIPRPEIYQILVTLEEKCIIEKQLTKPARYQATPFIHVLPALLNSKEKEQNQVRKNTQELIADLKKTRPNTRQETNDGFSIIPKRNAIIERIKEAISNSETSVSNITTMKRFSSAIIEFEDVYRQALQKGVKIRIATSRHNLQRKASRIVENLSENPNFQVRYFEEPAQAIVSVIDNRTASVILSATAHLSGASAIWSNNPCFVELAQNYFENKWQKAKTISTEKI